MEITLDKIAEKIDGILRGEHTKLIKGVASFENAGIDEITFLSDKKLLKKRKENIENIGAVILSSDIFDISSFTNTIVVKNPQFAFAKTALIFHPPKKHEAKISRSAHINTESNFGKDVSIGEFSYIGKNVSISDRVIIYPNVFIGDDVSIGEDTVIFPNVTICSGTIIGKRVIIQAGSTIGSDGYGYIYENGKHNKIPQIGIVQIDDDVEIGACNTIDRGALEKTWIKQGVKTDNLVHIAHNVIVGENTLIIAQVGIAGSTKIGNNVIIAGQAGIGGHIEIGDRAIIGPQAGIVKSVSEGEIVSSTGTQMPHSVWLRLQHILPQLPEMKKR